MTVGSENERPSESYSNEELIEYRKKQWEDNTKISADGFYDETPIRLRTTSFINVYEDMEPARAAQLEEILQGYPLIDLGGGLSGWSDKLLDKFGISRYINVDLQHAPVSSDNSLSRRKNRSQDLIEALLTIPDDQPVNVTSNGVLMGDWFPFAAHPQWYQNSPTQRSRVGIEQAYLDRLFQTITRVLPNNGVFMTYPNVFHDLAEEKGLSLDKGLSTFTIPRGNTQERVLAIYKKAAKSGITAK